MMTEENECDGGSRLKYVSHRQGLLYIPQLLSGLWHVEDRFETPSTLGFEKTSQL